jgi:hypothetical protein
MAASNEGTLHAVWDNSQSDEAPASAAGHSGHHHGPDLSGSGRAICYARARNGGAFEPATALAPAEGAFQMHPTISTAQDGSVYVAWSEFTVGGKSIVFVRLPKRTGVERGRS